MLIPPQQNLVGGRDKISASDYNRKGRILQNVARSHPSYSVSDSSGILVRRQPGKGITFEGETAMGSLVRRAYCKFNAEAEIYMPCYLDINNPSSTTINVYFSIAYGGTLLTASPRLTIGLLIFVAKFGGTWYCITVFQKTKVC